MTSSVAANTTSIAKLTARHIKTSPSSSGPDPCCQEFALRLSVAAPTMPWISTLPPSLYPHHYQVLITQTHSYLSAATHLCMHISHLPELSDRQLPPHCTATVRTPL